VENDKRKSVRGEAMETKEEQLGTVSMRTKKVVSLESFIFLAVFLGLFCGIGSQMGAVNMLNTMMNTAYQLLMKTVLYIMAIAVLAGAISALFSEFGVISLLNKVLSPLMKPLYGLPGAAAIGVVTTYLSDNPAILTLADDREFKRYFKKYQLPALTNIGTAFGMGLIITTYMIGLKSPTGESYLAPALIGNLGAIIGSIVSTRLMMHFTKKMYGTQEYVIPRKLGEEEEKITHRQIRDGSAGSRVMDAILTGGKSGVDMGLAIIPGVLIICTLVLMLTNGVGTEGYTGDAYQGIGLLPALGAKIDFILKPLFGFSSPQAIAVPITSLGAAGAAIGLVPSLLDKGLAFGNDIAVFTAMCMCWSGYLSTHVAMMDSLHYREATGKAILSHTIGGLCAGIAANWLYQLFIMIF
jgi:hypothetical protein